MRVDVYVTEEVGVHECVVGLGVGEGDADIFVHIESDDILE